MNHPLPPTTSQDGTNINELLCIAEVAMKQSKKLFPTKFSNMKNMTIDCLENVPNRVDSIFTRLYDVLNAVNGQQCNLGCCDCWYQLLVQRLIPTTGPWCTNAPVPTGACHFWTPLVTTARIRTIAPSGATRISALCTTSLLVLCTAS
jgi:hypothetical protein